MEAIIDKTIEEFTENENTQEITAQNGNEEVFKNNRSFGYYTIPFTINKHKYSAFKKRINTIISHSERDILSDSERFKSCRYVFSYIKEIYKTNDFYKIDSDALTREMNCPDVLDRLFPFSDKKSGERFPATLEEISILVFGKSKGYLMFKVCYNDMSLRDMEIFSYYFRHIVNSTENNCTFAQICAFILGVEKYESFKATEGDFTTPFYYLSFAGTYICDVLQLICMKTDFPEGEEELHLTCLGRGYRGPQKTTENYLNNNNYDIKFSPRTNVVWVGSPNTLTCVIKSEDAVSSHMSSNIENDYLCLFLTLQNQRNTLLSLMTDMVTYKNKPRELLKIKDKLNAFKLAESFKTVSNEYAFQNIYEQMYNILDIDNLIEDINDISTHAAEQKEHNIERLFKIFTAAATIETLYNILAVLVPLLVDWTKTGEMPLLFPTQIGTLALCVLTVLLLSILFILTPKLLKNK